MQRYKPAKYADVILACCILHNLLIRNNVPFDGEVDTDVKDFIDDGREAAVGTAAMRADAEAIRRVVAVVGECEYTIYKFKINE